jgi:predicted amidophosphoribosyltransferase
MTEWNKCPGCGITISGVADYCPNCGEPWTIQCPNCGITWRFWEYAKFCPNCGAPTERHGVTRGKQRQAALEVGKPKATTRRHSV